MARGYAVAAGAIAVLAVVASMFAVVSAATAPSDAGRPPYSFWNGVNQAWVAYGDDFGNNRGVDTIGAFDMTLEGIRESGGSTMRTWLHCTCANTPLLNSSGFVVATDGAGTMVRDLQRLLDHAAGRGVRVVISLFNAALMSPQLKGLIEEDGKMQSYIDNALVPIAKSLAGHPGLGGYEILNEMEGSVIPGQSNANACFDTRALTGTGAGWSGGQIPMYRMLRFIGSLAAAIRSVDRDTRVTSAAWSEHSITSRCGYYNYYADECLAAAAGLSQRDTHLSFYEVHTYATDNGQYGPCAPFRVNATWYGLPRPLIVGEFSSVSSGGMTSAEQYLYAFNNGYAGAWGWQANGSGEGSDTFTTLMSGMAAIPRR